MSDNGNNGNGHKPDALAKREDVLPIRVESDFERMSGISESEILQNLAAIARGDLSKLLDKDGNFNRQNIGMFGRLIQTLKFDDEKRIKEIRFYSSLEANKALAALAGLKPAERHEHQVNLNVQIEQGIKSRAIEIANQRGLPVEKVEQDLRKAHLALVKSNDDRAA